jgi:AcrR family transcriptional regulator
VGVADRRQRERETRRQAILESAALLFRERPYDEVSVEAIASTAELGKGTVYLYFPDKDAIVAELAASMLTGLRETGDAIADRVRCAELSVIEGTRRLLASWTETYEEVPWLFRLLVLDRPRLLSGNLAGSDAVGALLEPLERLVEIGRERGVGFRAVDPEVVARSLWALFVGGLLLERRGELEADDVRREGLAVLMALVRGFLETEGQDRSEAVGVALPAREGQDV